MPFALIKIYLFSGHLTSKKYEQEIAMNKNKCLILQCATVSPFRVHIWPFVKQKCLVLHIIEQV